MSPQTIETNQPDPAAAIPDQVAPDIRVEAIATARDRKVVKVATSEAGPGAQVTTGGQTDEDGGGGRLHSGIMGSFAEASGQVRVLNGGSGVAVRAARITHN